ncbi:phosphotransferase [Mycolicibacterium duvalii]|nr:phosphotransferase [Mycolicibacterium duvalii]PEG38871.1 phosphotransferase [Mycolicibacterium duvalii]
MQTAEQLARRTRRACAAALRAATALGLSATRARVLHDAFSVVVQLEPEPVVARIPVVLTGSSDSDAQHSRQQRELDVAGWLADRGVPVVRPAAQVPRRPVRQDGFPITFWELADLAEDHQPYRGADLAYSAELHARLADYPGRLPFLAPFNLGLPELLDQLRPGGLLSAADLDRVWTEFHAMRAVLSTAEAFQAAFPSATVQPIQGDAPSHNVIHARNGILFSDFEDVCMGPVEWDIALLGRDATAQYDAAAVRRGLRATDPDVQQLMDSARRLQFVGCLPLIDELPMLAPGLAQAVQEWRNSPGWSDQTGSW